jgi:hypothetical protein
VLLTKIWILKEITSERCTSDQLNTFSPVFFSDQVLIWKKRRKKCSTGQRFSKATFYKIHTLVGSIKNILISAGTKNHRQHVEAK